MKPFIASRLSHNRVSELLDARCELDGAVIVGEIFSPTRQLANSPTRQLATNHDEVFTGFVNT